jgi:hypothetical protein
VAKNAVSDAGQSADKESSSDTGNGAVVNASLAESRVQAILEYLMSAIVSALDMVGGN